MKIFLPFSFKGIGGTATFARKFQKGMETAGHEVFFEYRDDYDVLFLIVQAPFKYLLEAKLKHRPIIQRLDGTYYWTVARWMFPLYNLKAALIRHFFTDFTVYQSEYSRECAYRFLGPKYSDPSTIIYNGVDLTLFQPTGERIDLRDHPGQHIFFTASAFRRKDQIEPILEALEVYRKKYGSDWKLYIAGTFSSEVSHFPSLFGKNKNIVFLGKIENNELPRYERSADVFLFTHLNPPCPNNVIEAIACGLPICGVADGAMPELIDHGKNGLLLSAEGNAYWQCRSFNADIFSHNLHVALENHDTYSLNARGKAEICFSLEHMVEKYVTVITQTIV